MTHPRRLTSASALAIGVACLTARTIALDQEPRLTSGTFEVASIRPNRSADQRSSIRHEPGGRLIATNVPARRLVLHAYGLQTFQVLGGPDWFNSERFDVSARADGDLSADQMRVLLQKLLIDRFKLTAHRETRELPVYALRTTNKDGRPGGQLRHSDSDCSGTVPLGTPALPNGMPTCGFFGPNWAGEPISSGRATLVIRGMTMDAFGRALGPLVGRTVIDRTGLAGSFDGDFEFTSDLGPPPPPPGVPDPYDRDRFPSIFTVLPEHLGLKLEPGKGAVAVLIIDGAQKPTDN